MPRLFDLINSRLAYAQHQPAWSDVHAVDRVVAVLLIVVLAPLLAAIALLVKRSSPGPVLG